MYRGDQFSYLSRPGMGATPETKTQEDWSISPWVSPAGWLFQKIKGTDTPIPLAISPLLHVYQKTEKSVDTAIEESVRPLKWLPWIALAGAGIYLYAKTAGGRAAMARFRR